MVELHGSGKHDGVSARLEKGCGLRNMNGNRKGWLVTLEILEDVFPML